MDYEMTIHGKLPGLNQWTEATRSNLYKGAKMKKEAQDMCSAQIRKQFPHLIITKPIRIHYFWYERNTRRDHDNVSGFGHKVIQDALVSCGVLKDDGWNEIVGYTDTFAVDREYPRIVVILEEVEDGG